MQRQRSGAACKDRSYRNPKFEIGCWLKTDLLSLQERLPVQRMAELPSKADVGLKHKLMAGELPEKPLNPDWSQPTQYVWQLERRNAGDPEHIYRRCVIAEHQRPACGRPPPEALFPERKLPILKSQTAIGVQQSKPIDGLIWRTRRYCGNP